MIGSIFPILVLPAPFIAASKCFIAPTLQTPQLVNDGAQGWATEVNNAYFIAYSSDVETTDIIGNYASVFSNWTPALDNTDPPSHFKFVQKQFEADCAFYPAIDNYNGLFGMAWLESQPTGRLDLKYTDVFPLGGGGGGGNGGGGTQPPVVNLLEPGQHTFYVYPRILVVGANEKTENIPLSDITLVDVLGAEFVVDLNRAKEWGLEITLPYPVKAIKWTQVFRQAGTLTGEISTIAIQQNGFSTGPLNNVAINLYYSRSGIVNQRVNTDDKGKFTFNVNRAEYTFEVETQNLSFVVNQRLL